jgi:hypothetical protein
MKWGFSTLDFAWHAIDDRASHPGGVFKAECGHLLLRITNLYDELHGDPCGDCATIQLARAEQAQLAEE